MSSCDGTPCDSLDFALLCHQPLILQDRLCLFGNLQHIAEAGGSKLAASVLLRGLSLLLLLRWKGEIYVRQDDRQPILTPLAIIVVAVAAVS
jgi:hypothetical protein